MSIIELSWTAKKRGGSLNYHLGRRGPERRGGDGELRSISHAIFCQGGHHPEHLVHHQHNEDWSSSSNAIFYQLEVPAHLVHKLGYLWWRRLSVGPPFEVLPETRGHSTGGSPHRIAATNKHNIFMNNIQAYVLLANSNQMLQQCKAVEIVQTEYVFRNPINIKE